MSGPYDGPNVYTLMDAKGYPLYVGVTGNDMRLVKHSSDKPWWEEVRSFHIQKYDSIEEARVAEIDAIHNLNPRYNKIHKPVMYQDEKRGWYHFCPTPTCGWTGPQWIPDWEDERDLPLLMEEAEGKWNRMLARDAREEHDRRWNEFLKWEEENNSQWSRFIDWDQSNRKPQRDDLIAVHGGKYGSVRMIPLGEFLDE